METYRIAVLVGSLRRDSYNRRLAEAMVKLAPADFSFTFPDLSGLPLYNQDDDANQAETVKAFKAEIKAAHGILAVTPEYNRSVPGVLKNAIDHASRPYGDTVWTGKPAGIIGISIGALGTALAQQHLRNIFSFLDMPTMGQPEIYLQYKEGFFDASGGIGPASKDFLQGWMGRFADWVRRHTA